MAARRTRLDLESDSEGACKTAWTSATIAKAYENVETRRRVTVDDAEENEPRGKQASPALAHKRIYYCGASTID